MGPYSLRYQDTCGLDYQVQVSSIEEGDWVSTERFVAARMRSKKHRLVGWAHTSRPRAPVVVDSTNAVSEPSGQVPEGKIVALAAG